MNFSRTLEDDPPKLAEIKEITVSEIEVQGGDGLLYPEQPGGGGCIRAGPSRRRHLRRVLA